MASAPPTRRAGHVWLRGDSRPGRRRSTRPDFERRADARLRAGDPGQTRRCRKNLPGPRRQGATTRQGAIAAQGGPGLSRRRPHRRDPEDSGRDPRDGSDSEPTRASPARPRGACVDAGSPQGCHRRPAAHAGARTAERSAGEAPRHARLRAASGQSTDRGRRDAESARSSARIEGRASDQPGVAGFNAESARALRAGAVESPGRRGHEGLGRDRAHRATKRGRCQATGSRLSPMAPRAFHPPGPRRPRASLCANAVRWLCEWRSANHHAAEQRSLRRRRPSGARRDRGGESAPTEARNGRPWISPTAPTPAGLGPFTLRPSSRAAIT